MLPWSDTAAVAREGRERKKKPAKRERERNTPHEELLVDVLEGKVQGLGGEVADDVGGVAAPQGDGALVLDHATEAVKDALVLVLGLDLRGGGLHLQEGQKKQG